MRHLFFGIILMWGAAISVPSFACTGNCSSDTDCAAQTCKSCDLDFGVCTDCCEFTEAVNCSSGCTWTGTECRNSAATACGVIVPETPHKYRYVFFALLLAGVTAFFLYMRRRQFLAGKIEKS